MQELDKKLPNYSVMSLEADAEFTHYKVIHDSRSNEYALVDGASKTIASFETIEEADNNARFCAEALALYLRSNSAIMFEAYDDLKYQLDDLSLKYNVDSSKRYFAWMDEGNPEFITKTGFGPKASIHAQPVYGSEWYKVRYEILNTEVMFPSSQEALDAMNNFVNIDDWKVYDCKYDAYC